MDNNINFKSRKFIALIISLFTFIMCYIAVLLGFGADVNVLYVTFMGVVAVYMGANAYSKGKDRRD